MTDEAATAPGVERQDQAPKAIGDHDDPPLCQVCRQELSRTKSATSKVIDAILDAIFDFFERLFSPRGRGLRRFAYVCLSAYVGYLLIRRLWKGPGR